MKNQNEKMNATPSKFPKKDFDMISKVMQRIGERERLSPFAMNMMQNGVYNSFNGANEQYIGQNCFPVGGPSAIFICGEAGGGFDCRTSQHEFECEKYMSGQLDCPTNLDFTCEDVFVFSCMTFQCDGAKEGGKNFLCDAASDFMCSGSEFLCAKDHECKTGHLYQCTNEFSCPTKHTCSGGESCETPTSAGHSCAQGEYDRNGDETPGDFVCGWFDPGKGGSFDCKKEFTCNSKDEFQCEAGDSSFSCGGAAGGSTFKCTAKNVFDCASDFNCNSTATVKCNSAGTDYTGCKSSYSICSATNTKECLNSYKCKEPNNCVTPGFKCTSPSPYTPPNPPG